MVLKQKPRIDVVGVVVPLLVLVVTLPVAVSPFFGVAVPHIQQLAAGAVATVAAFALLSSWLRS